MAKVRRKDPPFLNIARYNTAKNIERLLIDINTDLEELTEWQKKQLSAITSAASETAPEETTNAVSR